MLLITLGFLLIIVGIFTINFPEFAQLLKEFDTKQWRTLGEPTGYNIMDNGKTLGLFSWLLHRGFDKNQNPKIKQAGAKAYTKAKIAKTLLISGVLSMGIGFVTIIALA